ncbi:MAG: HDOD domain-containing protein, partial [Candidatus Latescibacterota bacterium]|nr:HDOD domain-containing protein [Candidatus Latescibacterota bacterium]
MYSAADESLLAALRSLDGSTDPTRSRALRPGFLAALISTRPTPQQSTRQSHARPAAPREHDRASRLQVVTPKSPDASLDDQKRQRLKRITQSIIGLPTLPTVITELISLIDNPKTSARNVSQLISTDQALTAKILKLANSAFYGFPREIATVQHAVVVLGFETVKNLGL